MSHKAVPDTTDLIPLVDPLVLSDKNKYTTVAEFGAALAPATNGWQALNYAPNTVTYNGNRSYSLVFNAVDLTGVVSTGMRIRTTRTVNAPTQCTSLNGTNQYYSKSSPAGMTFTDDFTVSAWVKLPAYNSSANQTIVSRFNNTSGWELRLSTAGQVLLLGYNAGAANTSYVTSSQAIPLNRWVHVAAQLDMSTFTASPTTSYVMIDGLDVPATVARTGTNPVALVQAGSLEIGSFNGGSNPLNGKLAQVAVYSAKVTQATMRGYYSQGLLGTETSLISAYSFNNAVTDLNVTSANDLTANGSAVATSADSPFAQDDAGTPTAATDIAVITKKAFSTNTTITVQVPEGCTIPTGGGVSTVSYSSAGVPFGFPKMPARWRVSTFWRSAGATTSNAAYGAFQAGGFALTVPLGAWNVGQRHGMMYNSSTTPVYLTPSYVSLTALTASNAAAAGYAGLALRITSSAAAQVDGSGYAAQPVTITSVPLTYVMYTLGATTSAGIDGTTTASEMFAEFGYL